MRTASRELYGPHWHRDMPYERLQMLRAQWHVHLETGYGLFCAAIRDSVQAEIAGLVRQANELRLRQTEVDVSTKYGNVQIKTKAKCTLPRAIHQKICKSRWNALSKTDRDWWIKTAKIGPIFYSDVQAHMARGPPWALVRKLVKTRQIAFFWSELRAKEMKPGGKLYKEDHMAFECEMGK